MTVSRTESLDLATYLLATRKLRYLGCQPTDNRRHLIFLFEVPQGVMPELEAEFNAGAECSAISILDSLRRLRKVMTKVQKGLEYEHSYSQR